MDAVEWNKKPEIVIEQALRHVKGNMKLISRFTKSDRAQVVLLVAMQEHAYQNQTFLKIFSRLCLLFYKGAVSCDRTVIYVVHICIPPFL